MPLFQDILLDDDGDLKIDTGDIEIGLSDQQHIQDIFQSYVGWWRNFPQMGVGLFQYLQSSDKDQELVQVAKLNLIADGYVVNRVKPIRQGGDLLFIDTDASRP